MLYDLLIEMARVASNHLDGSRDAKKILSEVKPKREMPQDDQRFIPGHSEATLQSLNSLRNPKDRCSVVLDLPESLGAF